MLRAVSRNCYASNPMPPRPSRGLWMPELVLYGIRLPASNTKTAYNKTFQCMNIFQHSAALDQWECSNVGARPIRMLGLTRPELSDISQKTRSESEICKAIIFILIPCPPCPVSTDNTRTIESQIFYFTFYTNTDSEALKKLFFKILFCYKGKTGNIQ